MYLKTKMPNFLNPDLDGKTYNCINVENKLIQNMHKIYKQQREEGVKRKGGTPPHHLFDPEDYMDLSLFNSTPDVNNICVELKLKLDVRNGDGEADLDSSILLDINPRGVMSREQRTFVYEYRRTKPMRDKALDHLTREQRMKYFTSMSHQLAGRSITFQGTTYKLLNVLQTAIYGGVYLAQVVESSDEGSVKEKKEKKAIKILSKHLIELAKDKVQEDPLSEYHYRNCMSGHSNILSCDMIFDDDFYVYMIMPFAVHGDLFEVMKARSKPFTEEEAKYIFYQILLSIKFLHCRRLALRDISLENVLLFENERSGLIYPVLNDPGQATYFNMNKNNQVTLLEYKKIFGKIFRPPEVYEKCMYDPTRVDIFCVGYILYFCLTKQELFRCALAKDIHWNMLKMKNYHQLLREKKGLHLSEPALDFIFRCLEPNFKMRLEIGEALTHPWFRGNFFPVHNQSLFLLRGDDEVGAVDGGTVSSREIPKGHSSSLFNFKLATEIERCAKRKNVNIDQSCSIKFSIHEHVIVAPCPPPPASSTPTAASTAARPQVHFSGGNSPSPCLNSTHRQDYYPPEFEPHAEDGLIRGEKCVGDTPGWPTCNGAPPKWTDLNSPCGVIPPYVSGYKRVSNYKDVISYKSISGYRKEAFPTSAKDYLRGHRAGGCPYPSAHGIYAKHYGVVRKPPPPIEKTDWMKKYEDSASTHTCHTNWTEGDKQSRVHNSPASGSALGEESKCNFIRSHKKGAYRMIGMKRKKQKLSSDAEDEASVSGGHNLFVENPSSSFHVRARQALQTRAQDDTLKTVQKTPHMVTNAAVAKGRGLLSIFSEAQIPNGGGLPKNGPVGKKLHYPIGPFEEESFIHVQGEEEEEEEGQSGWGNILLRKNTPLEWNKNINCIGVSKWERHKDDMKMQGGGYQNGPLNIQQKESDKREYIEDVEEVVSPQCEKTCEVKLSESSWRDIPMGRFKQEEEKTYTVELEEIVSPMNGSPLHDVTIVTGGDTPQRTDRMDTNDSNEKNEETKNSFSYNTNGGTNGNEFLHLNEVLTRERNEPYKVVDLGEGIFKRGEEAPPSGLHNGGGDACRVVKRWCSLGGREIVWKDCSPKGILTPCEENFFSRENTPRISVGSHTDQHAHLGEGEENVKGTPLGEEMHIRGLPAHRDASYAYINMKDETESPRLNSPLCEENYSDVVTSHVESLKRCASPNKCEEQNQTGSNSFDRCSESESRQMCSIASRSESCSMDQDKGSTLEKLITTMSSCLSEVALEIDLANLKRKCPTPGGEAAARVGQLLLGDPHDEEEDFKDALEYELEHELEREIREEELLLERELEVELETELGRRAEVESRIALRVESRVQLERVPYVELDVAPSVHPNVVRLHTSSSSTSDTGEVRNGSGGTLKEQYESMSDVERQQGSAVNMHPNDIWGTHSISTKKANQEVKTPCKKLVSGKKTQQVGEVVMEEGEEEEEDMMKKRVALCGVPTKKRNTSCKLQMRKKKSTNKMKKVYLPANPEKKKSKIVRLQKCVLGEGLRKSSRSGPAKGTITKGTAAKPHPLGKHAEALHRKDRDEPNDMSSIINCTNRKGATKTKAKIPCDRKKCLTKRHTISELRPGGRANISSDVGGNIHVKVVPDLRTTRTSGKFHGAKSAGGKSTLLHLPDTRMMVEALRDVGKRHTICNATIDGKSREGVQVLPASRGTVGRISLKCGAKTGDGIRTSVGGIRSSVGGVLTSQVAKWNGKHIEEKVRRNHNQVHRTCVEERNQKELIKSHVVKEFKGKGKSTLVESHRGGELSTEETITIKRDSFLQGLNTTGLYANGAEADVDHGLLGSQDEVYIEAKREERDFLNGEFTTVGVRGQLDKHSAGKKVHGCQDMQLQHCLEGNEEAPSHYRSDVGEKTLERGGSNMMMADISLGKDYAKDKSALKKDPHVVVTSTYLKVDAKKSHKDVSMCRRKEDQKTRISSDELVVNKFLAEMGGNPPARVPTRDSVKKGSCKSIQPNKVNGHGEKEANVIKKNSSLCRSVLVASQRGNNVKDREKQIKKNESRRVRDGAIKRGSADVGGDRERCPHGVTPSKVQMREGKNNVRTAQEGNSVYSSAGKKDSYLEKRKTYVFFFKKGLKGKLEKMNQKAEAEKNKKKVPGILHKRTEMSESPIDGSRRKKTLQGDENTKEEEQKKLYKKVYPRKMHDVVSLESNNLHGQMTTYRCTNRVNEKGKEIYFYSGNSGSVNGKCHQSVSRNGVEVQSEVTPPRGNNNLTDVKKVVHFSHLDSKNERSNNSLGVPSMDVSRTDTFNFHHHEKKDGETGYSAGVSSPSNAQKKKGVETADGSFTRRRKDVLNGGNRMQGYTLRGLSQMGSVKGTRERELESLSRRNGAGDTRYTDHVKKNLEGYNVQVHQKGFLPKGLMGGEKFATNQVASLSLYLDHPDDADPPTHRSWGQNAQLPQQLMMQRRMMGGAFNGERTTLMETPPMVTCRTGTNVAGGRINGGKSQTHGSAKKETEGEKYNQKGPTIAMQHQIGSGRCSNGRTMDTHGKMKHLLNLNDQMKRSGEKNAVHINPMVESPSVWLSHIEQGSADPYLQQSQGKKKQSANPCLNLKEDEMQTVFHSTGNVVHLHASKVESPMPMPVLSPRNVTPGGVNRCVKKVAQIVPCNVVQKEEVQMVRPFSGHANYAVAKGTNTTGPTLRAYHLPNTCHYGAQNVFIRCNEGKVAYPMGDASGRSSKMEKRKNDQNRGSRNDAYAQVLEATHQGGTNKTYTSLQGTNGYANARQTKNNVMSGKNKKNSNLSILWWKT
ncbi:serine/threonine protein kinase [Plasmodium fragile]|uniref:Serine/threonine protein kinase n=1 Tax=Plasmodium fragile TaxID=5857 RepID=A0A0D9QSC3_PLAFR|nr:serine/threonine protein kinase [Plasmodium fragile]KJP89682.1 serine/threonine protein kinase [Plasmodium fragile]